MHHLIYSITWESKNGALGLFSAIHSRDHAYRLWVSELGSGVYVLRFTVQGLSVQHLGFFEVSHLSGMKAAPTSLSTRWTGKHSTDA